MQTTKYRHLSIEPSSDFRRKYQRDKRIGKILGSSAAVRMGVILLSKLLPIAALKTARTLAGAYAGSQRHVRMLKGQSSVSPLSFLSGFGYKDEPTELDTARHYKKQWEERATTSATESFDLYDHVVATVGKLLTDDPAIEVVSNFGVSYAHVDSELAKRFPDRWFVGIDRSKLTQQFNLECFPGIPNLEFRAQDIFEYLGGHTGRGVLMHMRTCILLPKSFLLDLYTAAAKANVQYIAGFEQVGWSRQTDGDYAYSDEDQDSVVFRGFMHMHNYPGILKQAGYKIECIELLKTAHPDEDYRIISFLASRAN